MRKNGQFYYLLGLFAGDGWFQKRGISIGTKDKNRATKIAGDLEHAFQKDAKVKRRVFPDGHAIYLVSLYSVEVEGVFRRLLGNPKKDKSKNFRVPRFPNSASKRAFVKGMFEAEAYEYVWHKMPRVAFEIFNRMAAKKIFSILRQDGIGCSFSQRKTGGCRIDITGKSNVSKFHSMYS